MSKSAATLRREIQSVLGSPGHGKSYRTTSRNEPRGTSRAPSYGMEEAWRVAMAPGGSGSVVDLDGGGYAVPRFRGPIAPPSRTRPIEARVPYGWVRILSGPHGGWRIV